VNRFHYPVINISDNIKDIVELDKYEFVDGWRICD